MVKDYFIYFIFSAPVILGKILGLDSQSLNTLVVFLTGWVVIKYTKETVLLRKETSRQTELSLKPLVHLEKDEKGFYLENSGNSSALNIFIKPVAVSDHHITVRFDRMIGVLKPGQKTYIKGESFTGDKSQGDFFLACIDPEYADKGIGLHIKYADIELKMYTTKQLVSNGKIEITEVNETRLGAR